MYHIQILATAHKDGVGGKKEGGNAPSTQRRPPRLRAHARVLVRLGVDGLHGLEELLKSGLKNAHDG